MYSYYFSPSIGGIQRTSEQLALSFAKRGHDVVVVTETPRAEHADTLLPYSVIRSPSPFELLRNVSRADVVFHNGICLRYIWAQLVIFRPWLVVVHIWLQRPNGHIGIREKIKQFAISRADRAVAVSPAIAATLLADAKVVGNSYDADIFHDLGIERSATTVVAVGRLESDKGFDVLIRAIGLARRSDHGIDLRIIGDGPELNGLRRLAVELGVAAHIAFLGVVEGAELNHLLNESEIMVVPSRWKEPFGIVALEGLAAGCVVVGTLDGGLPYAIGPCGPLVPRNDPEALAEELMRVVQDSDARDVYRSQVNSHLQTFETERVVDTYLRYLRSIVASRRRD
jgi:glycogen(starch) synthase